MVKVIGLSEDACATLKRRTRAGMSFSDVIIHEIKSKQSAKTRNKADLLDWVKSLPKPKSKKLSN